MKKRDKLYCKKNYYIGDTCELIKGNSYETIHVYDYHKYSEVIINATNGFLSLVFNITDVNIFYSNKGYQPLLLSNYFYTKQELRKVKLRNLNKNG